MHTLARSTAFPLFWPNLSTMLAQPKGHTQVKQSLLKPGCVLGARADTLPSPLSPPLAPPICYTQTQARQARTSSHWYRPSVDIHFPRQSHNVNWMGWKEAPASASCSSQSQISPLWACGPWTPIQNLPYLMVNVISAA